MKMRLICTAIFLAVILIGFEKANACSCLARDTPAKEYAKASFVFTGSIKKLAQAKDRDGFSDLKATFEVEEVFKGRKSVSQNIFTSSQGTACGYHFEEGDRYLVYAYVDEESKYLSTSICTRTRSLLIGKSDDEIEILRSLARGNFKPRIYGRVEEIVRGIFLLDDKENVPMAGIKVTARSGANYYESVTDKAGNFSFKNVKPGRYMLDLKLPATHKLGDDSWGFKEKQNVALDFTVTNTNSPDFITIETRVDGRIKGKVFDYQGNPVGKGVRITLVTKDTAANTDDKIQYIGTDTDKNGFYEFEGIPQGDYYLGVNLDLNQPYRENPYPKSFYPNAKTLNDAAIIKLEYGQRLTGFDIKLLPPLKQTTVKGKVLNKDGTPAVGVKVYVTNQARHDFEDFVWLKTDSNGEFTVTCLVGVTYRFAVYGKSYQTPNSEIIKVIEDQKNNFIKLSAEN